jgi:sporulation protein YlmC with PRC-barrel domain
MRIALDAKVKTADGHDAGPVRRALIDPSTQRVTGFVVGTGGLLGHDVIVGEDDFAHDSPGGDAVILRLSRQELDAQPIFDEGNFAPPPAGWGATMGYGFPSNAYLMPVEVAPDVDLEPARPTLKKGDVVKDRDGDVVGVVEELRLDDETKELTGFVVKAGAGVERLFGGGELADIPAEDILRVFDGEVRLVVDREEITPAERKTGTR